MSLDFKELKPELLGGIYFKKESSVFVDQKGRLRESIENLINEKKGNYKPKFESIVKIVENKELGIGFDFKDNNALLITLDDDSITFATKPTAPFSFFEKMAPAFLRFILKELQIEEIRLIGMMIRVEKTVNKEANIFDKFKDLSLSKNLFSILELDIINANRSGLELRYTTDTYLRHLAMRTDKKEKEDKILISLDTRKEEKIKINDEKFFESFFRESVAKYFIDVIENKLLKDIMKEKKQ